MPDAKRPERLEIAAVIAQLMHLGMETNQRSLFEHRRLLEQALDLIRRLRAGEPEDPLFDGEQSALSKLKHAYWSIATLVDHEIRAAMLIAAELLASLEPSLGSPLNSLISNRIDERRGTHEESSKGQNDQI